MVHSQKAECETAPLALSGHHFGYVAEGEGRLAL